MTTEPNLLQLAIWKNNLNLVKQFIRELDGVKDINFVIINELGYGETPLDWLNRQIIVATCSAQNYLNWVKQNIQSEFEAKTLNELSWSD